MIKIQLGGTVDPLERMLAALVQDWDELERWAVKYAGPDKVSIAKEEKERLLEKIKELRGE